ncbi:MAG: hypothetical protein Q8Q56_03525, partial [Alphaproteobacteria bacterium]|nr:hypothetical protein [Alphaproteobacteria bacterium]
MWDVKTIIEVIKSIPVIKQIWGYLGSSQNIKIEVFPHKEFRKPFGTYWIDKEGIEHPQLPLEL